MAPPKKESTIQGTKISKELGARLSKATTLNEKISVTLHYYDEKIRLYQNQIQRGTDSQGRSRPSANKNRSRFTRELRSIIQTNPPLIALGQVTLMIEQQLPEVKDGWAGFFGGSRESDYRKILEEFQSVLNELQPQWKNYIAADSVQATAAPSPQPRRAARPIHVPSPLEKQEVLPPPPRAEPEASTILSAPLSPPAADKTKTIQQVSQEAIDEMDDILRDLRQLTHGQVEEKCAQQELLIRKLNEQARAHAERIKELDAHLNAQKQNSLAIASHEEVVATLRDEIKNLKVKVEEAELLSNSLRLALEVKTQKDRSSGPNALDFKEHADRMAERCMEFDGKLKALERENAKLKREKTELTQANSMLMEENSRIRRVLGWLYNTLVKLLGGKEKAFGKGKSQIDYDTAPKDSKAQAVCEDAGRTAQKETLSKGSASSLFDGMFSSSNSSSSSSSSAPAASAAKTDSLLVNYDG